jgi:hypothetical protein
MPEHATARAAWESFYVIVGSSGGALIGLQFVVMTLIAERATAATAGAVSAFGTPTVVHFTGALAVAAVMSAPWPSLTAMSLVLAAGGLVGLAYGAVIIRRARRQTDYEPVAEDWFWYAVLPCAAYAGLALSGVWLHRNHEGAFFGVAAATLALLLVGIHNAWDTVTHIVMTSGRGEAP